MKANRNNGLFPIHQHNFTVVLKSACFGINTQLKLSKQKTSEDEAVKIIRFGCSLYVNEMKHEVQL